MRKHLGFSGIRQPKVQAESANILREKTNDLLLKDAIQRVPAKDYSLYVLPNCKSLWIKASAK